MSLTNSSQWKSETREMEKVENYIHQKSRWEAGLEETGEGENLKKNWIIKRMEQIW